MDPKPEYLEPIFTEYDEPEDPIDFDGALEVIRRLRPIEDEPEDYGGGPFGV